METQSGFKRNLVENVIIIAETTAGLDIKLKTGEITLQVVVDGSNGEETDHFPVLAEIGINET